MIDLARWRNVPYTGERFCAVLAARILAAAGIPYPEGAERPEDVPDWERVQHPRALDVVVFDLEDGGLHVGVCVDMGRFIHVERGSRSRVEYLSSPLWCSRIRGIYRYTPRTA